MAGDTEPESQEAQRDDFSFVNNARERETFDDNPVLDESCTHAECNVYENPYSFPRANDSDTCQRSGVVIDESTPGYTECGSVQEPEGPPPPSEWYANSGVQALIKLGEGDPITEGHCGLADPSESIIDEIIASDALRDEENWQAQYGQVVHSREEPVPDFHVVDLWDWEMVKGSRKVGKGQEARLVGRLVKRSAKLHPSMPSSCGLFRSAPICEVHLDLVRARTGQVYKLHSPSTRYLASLPTYDSSNPTKDWGFPELSITMKDITPIKSSGKGELRSVDGDTDSKCMTGLPNQLSASKMQASHSYRDRAAERRNLHGGFGVGPGQKSSLVDDVGGSSSPVSTSTEEAAAEALSMSFGAGSYARKILENMGWKEGEALGNTTKGLVEPVKAVGNMGNAGLGWPQGRMNLN
ncbi:unnamed protein product [Dovyalis caffra]|uniref:G-patch domain-containing protein n=1 Tax=Dovyalis caffra TaxID=77055 RepID=A0AAV1SDQ5_9ROSI|nr:unnamed protein product [Dovyalis caffra]